MSMDLDTFTKVFLLGTSLEIGQNLTDFFLGLSTVTILLVFLVHKRCSKLWLEAGDGSRALSERLLHRDTSQLCLCLYQG